ncbi:MAG: sigma-54-dependent Fis family transcriptional regulator [Desulfobacteraceae bacterium]|nr:sigma-54-dependent Fis family transcriptional regulator [Desulfobacteraceae bacterium]
MKKQIRILIVDNDPNILEVLEARLTAAKFLVFKASDASSAIKILKKQPIALMISDVKMPVMSGIDLFSQIRQTLPELPVIFLTAYGTIPDAVNALKMGAVDYISKPFDGKELINKINEIFTKNKPVMSEDATPLIENGFYWGKSFAMKDLCLTIKKVAASNVNVLILGESGVGKECIAKFIHTYSLRKDHPYIVVDCGSTPSGILESQLFGHMKGSFTHAVQDKKGLIEAAHKGTLFLDEIGNISQDMQSKILRFLENKNIRRVGAIKEIYVDCRVLSATNADLSVDIEKGVFREDLYYRLKGITLKIPPLRERKEDIVGLSHFFVKNYTTTHNLPKVNLIDSTLKLLESYSWPGNVRELKNTLEAGIVLCKNNRMLPSDLQLENIKEKATQTSTNSNGFSIEESEKDTIIRALKQTNGVQKNAAELLKISRRSINYKIKKYNINISECKNCAT